MKSGTIWFLTVSWRIVWRVRLCITRFNILHSIHGDQIILSDYVVGCCVYLRGIQQDCLVCYVVLS